MKLPFRLRFSPGLSLKFILVTGAMSIVLALLLTTAATRQLRSSLVVAHASEGAALALGLARAAESSPTPDATLRSLVGESKGFNLKALEPFRADGLHQAMYIVPILATLLAIVLFAASRTVKKDVARLQDWMKSAQARN